MVLRPDGDTCHHGVAPARRRRATYMCEPHWLLDLRRDARGDNSLMSVVPGDDFKPVDQKEVIVGLADLVRKYMPQSMLGSSSRHPDRDRVAQLLHSASYHTESHGLFDVAKMHSMGMEYQGGGRLRHSSVKILRYARCLGSFRDRHDMDKKLSKIVTACVPPHLAAEVLAAMGSWKLPSQSYMSRALVWFGGAMVRSFASKCPFDNAFMWMWADATPQ